MNRGDLRELVSEDDLQTLAREAFEAGDHAQVELCERALRGDDSALQACVDAMLRAAAMADEEEYFESSACRAR